MWPESYHHCHISIHAPMRGRSIVCSIIIWSAGRFQSTPPCGGDPWAPMRSCVPGNFNPRPHAGATGTFLSGSQQDAISIHAPMRGRPKCCGPQASGGHFNPRPHAGATEMLWTTGFRRTFQSTPPCGGDAHCPAGLRRQRISIHAPMRGRQMDADLFYDSYDISIHAPMRGRHLRKLSRPLFSRNFNPRPHAGATEFQFRGIVQQLFQSTPPCGGDLSPPT